MKGEYIPEDDVVRRKAVVQNGSPYVRIRRFIHALPPLGVAGHKGAVGTARPLAVVAQDHSAGHLLVRVQEHALARNGYACKAAALIAGGFGDEEVFGVADTAAQVVRQLAAADEGRVGAAVAALVVIAPGIIHAVAFILPQ